jgi:hypothetical protein
MTGMVRYCQTCGVQIVRRRRPNGQLADRKRFLAKRYCSSSCAKGHLPTLSTPLDRFHSFVQKSPSGCWLWTGADDGYGYGRINVDGAMVKAHRFAYEAFVAPIPAGVQIDHICRIRACVNPAHLRLATSAQNAQNRTANSTSSTGIRGVRRSGTRWVAEVRTRKDGVLYRERFDTCAEASAAAEAARVRLLTHYVPGTGVRQQGNGIPS